MYKEQPASEELPDETPKEISFKQKEEEADIDLALPGQKTDGKKPMIQEMASVNFEDQAKQSVAMKQKEMNNAKPFDWDTAEQIDSKFTFINQGDLVFVNFNFKGYKKESDIRYALSDNEILLEVRDVAKNKVHRVCKTLYLPIVC